MTTISEDQIKTSYPWLNTEFFQSIFREKYGSSDLKVTEWELKPALQQGENFSSLLIRATIGIKGRPNKIRTIIKVEHRKSDVADMVDEFNTFAKEIEFYKNILPEVHRLLSSVGINAKLSAEFISYGEKPRYVMFEDLTVDNYRNVDKRTGLDYEHMRLTMERLAYWHAATAVLGETKRKLMDSFLKGMVSRDVDVFYPVFINVLKETGSVFGKWRDCEEIGKKLIKLSETFVERCIETFEQNSENSFRVLNHGDLWCNNIMYKYDDSGNLLDTIFVDYAVGWFGNAGIDLAYLLFTSSAHGMNAEDWDYLIQHYHNILVDTLVSLHYNKPLPKLMKLQQDFLEKSKYPMVISFLVHNLRQLVDRENADTNTIVTDCSEKSVQFRMACYNSPEYRKNITPLIQYLNRKGLLD